MTAQPQSSTVPRETSTPPTFHTSQWAWALLAPYVVIAVIGSLLAGLGELDQLPTPRLSIGLVFLLSAVLAHLGLYNDIRSVRTASQRWSPRYWRYAIGGAGILLSALLVINASVPGGIVGAIVLSLVLGVVLSIPAYVVRRYAASQPADQ